MKLTGVMKSDKGRILLVEDEAALVDIYHDYLETKGYDFLTTKDIAEALQLTKTEQPDVVLLDIIIPKPENTIAEQGWEYLTAVKKDPLTKNIPILMFTNLDTHQDRVKSEKMGAAGFIFKRDCSPREVVEAIDSIIQKRRAAKK